MLKVQGGSNAYLVHKYLAWSEAWHMDKNDNKVIERRGYEIQWQNIKSDLKKAWNTLGNPIGLIHPLPLYAQFGAIAVDSNWAASTYQATNASTTSLTYTSHVVSGSNRVMVIQDTDLGGDPVTGVTFNGASATKIIEGVALINVQIWRKIAPDTGAHTVAVNKTVAEQLASAEISFTGADQTQGSVGTATNSATSTSLSTSVTTTAANSFVVDWITHGNLNAATPGQGTLTNDFNASAGQFDHSGHYIQKATAGAQTMSWSWTGSNNAEMVAIEVLAAPTVVNSGFFNFMPN